jgi:hypothetical protein
MFSLILCSSCDQEKIPLLLISNAEKKIFNMNFTEWRFYAYHTVLFSIIKIWEFDWLMSSLTVIYNDINNRANNLTFDTQVNMFIEFVYHGLKRMDKRVSYIVYSLTSFNTKDYY